MSSAGGITHLMYPTSTLGSEAILATRMGDSALSSVVCIADAPETETARPPWPFRAGATRDFDPLRIDPPVVLGQRSARSVTLQ